MPSAGSITQSIRDLERGLERDKNFQVIWDRLFELIARYAERLRRSLLPTRAADVADTQGRRSDLAVIDDEDAALSAFARICRGIELGQLQLASRVDLIRLLVKTTERELRKQIQRERRLKRGGRNKVTVSYEEVAGTGRAGAGLGPGQAASEAEGCRRLLDALGHDQLRRVAVLKLLGYTNHEVAASIGKSPPTVEYYLARIRQTWADEVPGLTAKCGRRGASKTVDVGDAIAPASSPRLAEPENFSALLALLVGKAVVDLD